MNNSLSSKNNASIDLTYKNSDRHPDKTLILVLVVFSLLATVKSIFTDFAYDNAYTMALSFRHLQGDRLFGEIWDTTQTSIFVTDFFLLPFKMISSNMVGAALYLQICSAILYGVVCFIFQKALSLFCEKNVAVISSLFLYTFRVKQSVFVAYADQQIMFSILLFAFLLFFLKKQTTGYLITAALSLCLETLSYPSAAITLFGILFFLFLFTEKRAKNMLLFVGTCLASGGIYILYFILARGYDTFLTCISMILKGDSHSSFFESKAIGDFHFWQGFLYALLWLIIIAGISCLTSVLLRRKHIFLQAFSLGLFVSEIVLLLIFNNSNTEWTCSFYIIPSLMIFIGSLFYSKLDDTQKKIWLLSLIISISSLIATFLFTNLTLITIFAYLVLCGATSFIPVYSILDKKNAFCFLFAITFLVICHRGLIVWGYGNSQGRDLIFEQQNYIRVGADKFIVCDTDTANYHNGIKAEFEYAIDENDSYMLINGWLYDPAILLYNNGSICNPNITDTPNYNSTMVDYFNLYELKKPDVVAIEKNVYIQDDVLRDWIAENYIIVYKGMFYDYYRFKTSQMNTK